MDEEETLQKFQKRASNDLVAIHQELQHLRWWTKELYSRVGESCQREELKSLSNLLHEFVDGILQNFDKLLHSFSSLNQKVERIEDIANQIGSRVAELEADYVPFRQLSQVEFGQLRTQLKDNVNLIHQSAKELSESFKSQIEAIPHPEVLDLVEIRKNLQLLCQDALDDAKAADNRTITNQSRIHILEKKVAKLQGDS